MLDELCGVSVSGGSHGKVRIVDNFLYLLILICTRS